MGYNLRITRSQNRSDGHPVEISLSEWQRYLQSDSEMEVETKATAITKDMETVEFESEGLCFWRSYSKHGVDGNKAWFLFDNGDIVVKNPDVEITNKMIAIAASLEAKVQGDDGEEYNEIDGVQKRKWWKFWLL